MPERAISTGYPDADRVAALWRTHVEAPTEATAEALMSCYLPLVRGIVRSMTIYARPDMGTDDLFQYALLGLWDAVCRYDPDRGGRFTGYAARRIRGSVLDALRRHDTLTRTDRALLKTLREHVVAYVETHAVAPDEETLAADAKVSLARLRDVTERAQPWLSLDRQAVDGAADADELSLLNHLADPDSPDPSVEAMQGERAALFRRAFRMLPHRQRVVLYLYYYEDLTLNEIGAILNVSEARVCQVHAAALVALKAMLAAVDEGAP